MREHSFTACFLLFFKKKTIATKVARLKNTSPDCEQAPFLPLDLLISRISPGDSGGGRRRV